MEMLSAFPCLMPVCAAEDGVVFDGYLTTAVDEFRIRVFSSRRDHPADLLLECEWRLHCLLAGYQDLLLQRLKQTKNLQSFLKELQSVVDRLVEQKPVSIGNCGHSRRIVEEMEKIGWEKLMSVDASFQNLVLQCCDEGGRHHQLKVQLSTQETAAPQCITDLPWKFEFKWSPKGHLSDLLQQFEAVISTYQPFWNVLSVVDQRTWVLEPDTPSFSARHRRIALSPGTSIQITVDPKHPTTMPECRFLGADHVINPLKEKLNANLSLWDESNSLVANLEMLLDQEFPSPTNSKKEDFSLECGICYSYRLGEEIPDKACDDPHCGQTFHHTCLYEWMRSLPSCQQSFNTIFGECPLCSKPITIKIPSK